MKILQTPKGLEKYVPKDGENVTNSKKNTKIWTKNIFQHLTENIYHFFKIFFDENMYQKYFSNIQSKHITNWDLLWYTLDEDLIILIYLFIYNSHYRW